MMSENEYIRLSNKVKLRSAVLILNTLVSGEDYGFTDKDLSGVFRVLDKTASKIKIKTKEVDQ